MFINENVCFLVTTETHMLAAVLEGMALRIGCAKQEFHGPMNSWKRGLDIKSWQLFSPHTNYCNMGKFEIYLVGEIEQHGHEQEKY
jgi:hypothetical protein